MNALSWLALGVVGLLAWWLLVATGNAMLTMQGEGLLGWASLAMMRPLATAPYLGVAIAMWVVMMIAMMSPAALATLNLFRRTRPGVGTTPSLAFAGGYLALWSGFGVLLALLQWQLHANDLLHSMLLKASPRWAGALLLLAGFWQFTPWKRACLAHCQNPFAFLLNHWREGLVGAFRMGAHHGRYCLGCCWALMGLMFVGGVMSATTMAVLSLFILAERVLPPRGWALWLPGGVLLAAGAALLLA